MFDFLLFNLRGDSWPLIIELVCLDNRIGEADHACVLLPSELGPSMAWPGRDKIWCDKPFWICQSI